MPSQDNDHFEEMSEALYKGDVLAFERALDRDMESDPGDANISIGCLLLSIHPQMHSTPDAGSAIFEKMVEALVKLTPLLADSEHEDLKRNLMIAEGVSLWNEDIACGAIEKALAELAKIGDNDSARQTEASPNASPSPSSWRLRL